VCVVVVVVLNVCCGRCRSIDFGELLSADVRCRHEHTTYDLIANVVHDGEPGPSKGTYRVHILHKVNVISV